MYTLSSWKALVDQYPSYADVATAAVKTLVGGGINSPDIQNSCAIRMSRCLNYNAIPIPGNLSWVATRKGSDKKNYALRVKDLRKWFVKFIGKPDFEVVKKPGAEFDKKPLASLKGIIAFDIHFKDATGHFDLWDGAGFTHEPQITGDYFTMATKVSLWTPETYS